jgi:hypothetical protein
VSGAQKDLVDAAVVVVVVSHGEGEGSWLRWAGSGGEGACNVERQIALCSLVSLLDGRVW